MIARNLSRRGVRTTLTIVGLAVGVSAVVSLLGIAWGFERSFMAIYESKGIDLIVVKAGSGDPLTSNLDIGLVDKIKAVPGVKDAAGSLTDLVSFEEANLPRVITNGWMPGDPLFKGIRVLEGQTLKNGEPQTVMLGRVLAMNLQKKVGDPITLMEEPFKVVGVYESGSPFENGGLIVPLKTLQRLMLRDFVSGIVVSVDATDPAKIKAIGKDIERAVGGVAAAPARDFVQGDNQIRLVNTMAWATTIIAMILGSVGVLNTMLMTVFERTREIGILRALGWRRNRVLALILGEAAAQGVIGSTLGVALGYLSVKAFSRSSTASLFISSDLSPAALGLGLLMGLALSLIGGFYPAFRASRLEPSEAIRHD